MITDTTTTVEYVEITRDHKPAITWFDKPAIYGEDGYTEAMSGSDMATLTYLYGSRIRFIPLHHADPIRVGGKQISRQFYRVILREEAA